mgnify:CR=1 FL=1
MNIKAADLPHASSEKKLFLSRVEKRERFSHTNVKKATKKAKRKAINILGVKLMCVISYLLV